MPDRVSSGMNTRATMKVAYHGAAHLDRCVQYHFLQRTQPAILAQAAKDVLGVDEASSASPSAMARPPSTMTLRLTPKWSSTITADSSGPD